MSTPKAYLCATCLGLVSAGLVVVGRPYLGEAAMVFLAIPAGWYILSYSKALYGPDRSDGLTVRHWEASLSPGAVSLSSAVIALIGLTTYLRP